MTTLAARQAILSAIEQHQAVPVDAGELKRLRESHAELLAALKEMLAAERFSSRPPETVFQAEAKLDRIRAAAAQARAAVSHATQPRPDQSEAA